MKRPSLVAFPIAAYLTITALTARAGPTEESARGGAEFPAIVTLNPAAEWTDTGIVVHKGERFVFAAVGEVYWQARDRAIGPDGDGGVPGWRVGPGGLRGRIGASGRPFDLGSRTHILLPPKHARPPRDPYVLPPVTMAGDGSLSLGFKQFTAGANSGHFEVTIRPPDSPPFDQH